MQPVVIIGSGQAGYSLAREMRKLDAELPLQIITADSGSFYSKPMLSNALSKGKTPRQLSSATASEMAAQLNARVETGTQVLAIDSDRHQLATDHGEFRYSRLVLALGADPIRLSLEGDAAHETLSINDLADYAQFRDAVRPGQHILIMGAGLIGCEFANDLVANGYGVTVIDPGTHPLGRLLPAECGADLKSALEKDGVSWQFQATVDRIDRTGSAYRVALSNGTTLSADHILSAVGLRPRTGLASDAGLACNRGIRVDRCLRTSDPSIFALGDCAEVEGRVLPFIMPIMHAARALAKTLCGEQTEVAYPAMPVVVKTPSCPIVIAPPETGAEGQWSIENIKPGHTLAEYRNPSHELLGFALTGEATSEKQRLTRKLPELMA